MASAKDITVKPISGADARRVVQAVHYSGKTVNNSQLHMGVFLNGRLEGAMQFGPPMKKTNCIGLVEGTPWNGFLELNRMAFSEALPRNSESRALAVALRLIRKHYPHVQWVVSFADGTQCGDGTIYRASGFVLTDVRKNTGIWLMPDGTIGTRMTYTKGKHILKNGKASNPQGVRPLSGFQLRYMYFLDPTARERLTVPILPFSKIDEMGAGMYRGKSRPKQATSGVQPDSGGATPTRTLQDTAEEAAHAC
jgi:hypothetical protein